MADNLIFAFGDRVLDDSLTIPGYGAAPVKVLSDNGVRSYIQDGNPNLVSANYTEDQDNGFLFPSASPEHWTVSLISSKSWVQTVDIRLFVYIDYMDWLTNAPDPARTGDDIQTKVKIDMFVSQDGKLDENNNPVPDFAQTVLNIQEDGRDENPHSPATEVIEVVVTDVPIGVVKFVPGEIKNAHVQIFFTTDEQEPGSAGALPFTGSNCWHIVEEPAQEQTPDGEGLIGDYENPVPETEPDISERPIEWDPSSSVQTWRSFTTGAEPADMDKADTTGWVADKSFPIVKKDGVTQVDPVNIKDIQSFAPWDPQSIDAYFNVELSKPARSGHIDNLGSGIANAQRGVVSNRINLARILNGLWTGITARFSYLYGWLRDIYDQIAMLNTRIDKIVFFMGPIDTLLFSDAKYYGPPNWASLSAYQQDLMSAITIEGVDLQTAYTTPVETTKGNDGEDSTAVSCYGVRAAPGGDVIDWFSVGGATNPFEDNNEEVASGHDLAGWRLLDITHGLDLPVDGKFVFLWNYPIAAGNTYTTFRIAAYTHDPDNDAEGEYRWRELLDTDITLGGGVGGGWWHWETPTNVFTVGSGLRDDVSKMKCNKLAVIVRTSSFQNIDQDAHTNHWGGNLVDIQAWTKGRHQDNIA